MATHKQHAADNKSLIDALVSKARKQGYFPIMTGRTYPADKCCFCGKPAVLSFRNRRGRVAQRCFSCNK